MFIFALVNTALVLILFNAIVTKAGVSLPSIITHANNILYTTGFKVHILYYANKITPDFEGIIFKVKKIISDAGIFIT